MHKGFFYKCDNVYFSLNVIFDDNFVIRLSNFGIKSEYLIKK